MLTLIKFSLKIPELVILISDEDLEKKSFKDKGYSTMIKRSILLEDRTILNVYTPNNRASHYMKQKLIELQGDIDEPIIIGGDINIPFSETQT